jgi:L-iditol 2-dehydrogenase
MATVIQPLACVLFTVDLLDDVEGKQVAVIGQGPLGVLFSHVLKAFGAAHVTGVDLIDRSDVAAEFGVDRAVWNSSSAWSANILDADRPDIVVEAVGHQVSTVNDAIAAAGSGAQIFCFGVPDDLVYPVSFERAFRKNLTLRAGAATHRTDWLRAAAEYLADSPALPEAYVTHSFAAKDAQAAFELASRPARGRLKVAVTP